jgi:peroxiredoxin
LTATVPLKIGDPAPELALPDTEGAEHRLTGEGAPATVVVFTCNHCPYALAWHDRILAAARDYSDRGVRFLAVNPNDGRRYPADSYEAMRERVRADGGWPLPYLRDETQVAARAYGARVTPDVFVLDGEDVLRYRGAPDADHGRPQENASWLREALDDVLAGREPRRAETEPVGCSVKWRS